MPQSAPRSPLETQTLLERLGREIRKRRKLLKVSAVVTAESANISRATLHRIERGHPSVTMGAYFNVIAALGLNFQLTEKDPSSAVLSEEDCDLPEKIKLSDYPELKKLGWALDEKVEMTAREVLDLYERNWRHLDQQALNDRERTFINKLIKKTGRRRLLV